MTGGYEHVKIQNGKLVGDIPDSGVFGQTLLDELNPGHGRRGVLLGKDGVDVEAIDPRKRYSKQDLISSRTGKPLKASTMPDRTKGCELRRKLTSGKFKLRLDKKARKAKLIEANEAICQKE